MIKNSLFVDTGAWFALADKSDQYHNRACSLYPQLLRNYNHLITTNFVIAETYILIRRAIGHEAAITFLENIAASPRVREIYFDSLLEKVAKDILRKYQDQDFSYTDAVSFAVMMKFETKQAFSFDQHFVTAGFTLVS